MSLLVIWPSAPSWQAMGWSDAANGIPRSKRRIGKLVIASLPSQTTQLLIITIILAQIYIRVFYKEVN